MPHEDSNSSYKRGESIGISASENILELQSISKIWRKTDSMPALSHVDLMIKRHSVIAIVGRSGTGKTTLLKIISGLIEPTSGIVICDKKPISSPISDIAMVFQDYGHSLLPWRTVSGNVTLPLEHLDINAKERGQLAREALAKVGMANKADCYPRQLSGGMQQRVVIARAIAQRAKILLLDEPFSALDSYTKYHLQMEFLAVWEAQGITVLMVSHDVEDAILLSDRVIVLDHANPSIAADFEVILPWPRDFIAIKGDPLFNSLRKDLVSVLFGTHGKNGISN